jgi:hypothetical protein
MDGYKSAGPDWLRELSTREGEAIEAYGRALKAYGSGAAPAEILFRDLADLTIRAATSAANLWVRSSAAYLEWGLSLAGIRLTLSGEPPSQACAGKPD